MGDFLLGILILTFSMRAFPAAERTGANAVFVAGASIGIFGFLLLARGFSVIFGLN